MIRSRRTLSPVIKARRRRCLCCQKLFGRDPRTRSRQKYCSEPECRVASKRASQRRWLRKPEHHGYFCGEQHVDRVQAWRAANPGYGRESLLTGQPLQEMIRAQPTDRFRETSTLPLPETRRVQGTVAIDQGGSLRGTALQDVL